MRQASVRTTDRIVFQIGIGLGEHDDCDIITLTDEKYEEIKAALAGPNGGVIIGDDGTLTVLGPPPAPEPQPTTADLLGAVADRLEKAITPKQQADAIRDFASALRGAR